MAYSKIERGLQSVVDRNGHNIALMEQMEFHEDIMKPIRKQQTALKRALGEIVRLRRENVELVVIAHRLLDDLGAE